MTDSPDVRRLTEAPKGWSNGLTIEQERIYLSYFDEWEFDWGQDRYGWWYRIVVEGEPYMGEGSSKRMAFDDALNRLREDWSFEAPSDQIKDFNGRNKVFPKSERTENLVAKLV